MNQKLIVLGAGESGVGAAILGVQQGFDVFVSDKGDIREHYRKILEHQNVRYESGRHSEAMLSKADIVIKSPGIPDTVPVVKALVSKGIPVISEIEFAARYTDAVLIGITGSNGKTTTSLWVHDMLVRAGFNVGIAGNIGDSFAGQVATKNYDCYVLELSSFQLDGIEKFAPHIAVITNITPDHLDRYDHKFEQYIASKFLIAKNQKPSDFFIYDADDPVVVEGMRKNRVNAKQVSFSLKPSRASSAFVNEGNIQIQQNKQTITMDISKLALKGKHNTKNAMASSLAAQMMQARKQAIIESLENFEGVEHRLEKVVKINGVQYINDSKATNVNAVFYALECMDASTVWIVGGVDKGNDYMDLMPLVREKVKAIICLGIDNEKIKETFGGVVDLLVETSSAEEAVKTAYKISHKGDVVLLSPACASFDLFENYEERGRRFKEAVRQL